MAAPISAKRLMMVGALVVVVAMLAAPPTEANEAASSFWFYQGSSCSGCKVILNACGCNTVPYNTHEGYKFNYASSQSAAAYNGPGCTGEASTRFLGGAEQCTPVGWQSVFIQC